MSVVRAGSNVVYFNGVGTPSSLVRPSAPVAQPSDGLPLSVQVLLLLGGQSNAVGFGSTPVLSTSQPYSNLRWNRSTEGFDALIESSAESPASGLANWLTSQEGGRVSVVDNWGVNATTYSGLAQGTTPYNNMIEAVTEAAAALGTEVRVAVPWVHGENDELNDVDAATYSGFMSELQADIQADIRAALGVEFDVPLVLSQFSAWNQIFPANPRGLVALGQLDAGLNVPNVYCAGPNYHLAVQASGNNLHYTNVGARRLGEYLAKVVRRVVIQGQDWEPLHMETAVAVGNVITVEVDGGDGSDLAVDTTNMQERHTRGFEYTDESASPAAITGVTVSGRSATITLNKDAAASGVVRYALTADYDSRNGPTGTGIGGNIRDQDPTLSRQDPTDAPLYNWLSSQELALGSFTAAGVVAPTWDNTQSVRQESAGQHVVVPEFASLDGVVNATFSMWIKRDTAPPSAFAFHARSQTGAQQFQFRVNTNGSVTIFLASNLSTLVSGTTAAGAITFGAAAWHHVAVVLDLDNATNDERVHLYIDQVDTAFVSPPTWPTALTTGSAAQTTLGANSLGLAGVTLFNWRDAAWFVGTAADQTAIDAIGAGPVDLDGVGIGPPDHWWRGESDFADYGASAAPRHGVGFSGVAFEAVVPPLAPELGPFQFEPQAGERNALLWTGLSYVFGLQGNPSLSTSQPYDNVQALNPSSPRTPEDPAALIPLVVESGREGIYVGSANQLARNWAALRDWVVAEWGIAGELGDRDSGSPAYASLMSLIDDSVTLVDPDSIVYRAVCWSGIGFAEERNGVSWATFETDLLALFSDYQDEVESRCGQTWEMANFFHQAGFWALGATPVVGVYAVESLLLALATAGMYMTGPAYQYDVGGDNIHLTSTAYLALAEHMGEVMYQVMGRGIDWEPLHITSAVVGGGDTVVLTYHVPAVEYDRHGGGEQLVLDETIHDWREAAADDTTHGFRYIEGAGSARAVTGVSISGNEVTLQLDGAADAGAEIGYADIGAQPPNAARGNLRDNWANAGGAEGGDDTVLYNWAVSQRITIT